MGKKTIHPDMLQIAVCVLLLQNLKTAGANVDFVFEPEAGHQMPNSESIRKFHDWLAAEIK